MKIIIDTNIYISYFLFKSFTELTDIFNREEITLICSQEILDEIEDVLNRPKFNDLINSNQINEIKQLIIIKSKLYFINKSVYKCRDEKDNHVLGLADISKADYIITGDDDLLALKQYKKTLIIKFRDFNKVIKNN